MHNLFIKALFGIIAFSSIVLALPEKTITSQIIQTDLTWSNDTIYKIVGNLLIGETATVTILPGTHLDFAPNVELRVQGTLVANGKIDDSIYFSGTSWLGIILTSKTKSWQNNQGSIFNYCVICNSSAYGGWALKADSCKPFIKNLHIYNSYHCLFTNQDGMELCSLKIHNSNYAAIQCNKMATIKYCEIDNMGCSENPAIYMREGGIFSNNSVYNNSCMHALKIGSFAKNATISFNNIYNNQSAGIVIFNYADVNVEYNNITANNPDILIDTTSTGAVFVSRNNFAVNSNYNIKLRGSNNVSAPDNYWGTTDTNIIELDLLHVKDNYKLGTVYYKPFSGIPIDSIDTKAEKPANDIAYSKIKCHPNPFNTSISILLINLPSNPIMQIYDINGKSVAVFQQITNNKVLWTPKLLPNGIYFIKVETVRDIYQKKIVHFR